MQTQLLTYRDIVDHALDYMGAATDATTERFARRAVQMAVSEYWSKRTWTIGYRRGRILTTPPYAIGTVTYTKATNTLTLTGGTWPSWVAEGTVTLPALPTGVAVIPYPVLSQIDANNIKLQPQTAPNQDMPTPLTYTLVQDSYRLPVDFGSVGEIVSMGFSRELYYVPPGEFVEYQRSNVTQGNPYIFTVVWDWRRLGSLSMQFYPPPNALYTFDFSYQRQGRALNSHGLNPVVAYTDGSASVGASSTSVTGTGTAWTPDMAGCVIRFSSSPSSKTPTGPGGASPFYVQRIVTSVSSPASLTIDAVTGTALTSVPHAISDPVDLEAGSMSVYFLREVEKQARMVRRMKPEAFEDREYQMALMGAFEADNRHMETRATFSAHGSMVQIHAMPSGPPIGA